MVSLNSEDGAALSTSPPVVVLGVLGDAARPGKPGRVPHVETNPHLGDACGKRDVQAAAAVVGAVTSPVAKPLAAAAGGMVGRSRDLVDRTVSARPCTMTCD